MKYIVLLTSLALAAGAYAADAGKKSAQEKPWTDEYQYGEKAPEADTPSAESEKPKKEKKAMLPKRKKTKPSEGGEFDVAPQK